MKQRILVVNYSPTNKETEGVQEVPYLFMTLKSFFNRNSKNPDAWEWLDPIYSAYAHNVQELLDQILIQKPDVLAISCYVWNEALTLYLAEQVKLQLPSTRIIAGGPSITYFKKQDYFKTYWYIDAVCQYQGYGELFITDYLDGAELKDVSWAVYPDMTRHFWLESNNKPKPSSFVWPMPYSDNIDYLKRFKQKEGEVKLMLDTSRGCPYGCVFCEWGGGTNSRVTFKGLDDVIQELEVGFEILKPLYIDINNANFGIHRDDLEITKAICRINEEHDKCCKDVNIYGPSKSSKPRLKEIMRLFMQHGIVRDFKLSIQSTHQFILDNIKRTDMDYADQLDLYDDLFKEYNIQPKFEHILGLPGETLDTWFETYARLNTASSNSLIHDWMALESAPSSKEPYFSNMKLKLKRIKIEKNTFGIGIKRKIKEDETEYRSIIKDDKFLTDTLAHYVISTYSYTEEDWCDMKIFRHVIAFLKESRLIYGIVNHLENNDIDMADFYKTFYFDFLAQTPILKQVKQNMLDQFASDDSYDTFYIDIAPNLPLISYYSVMKFFILLDPKKFYEALGDWLLAKYKDDYLKASCTKIGNLVQSPMYDNKLSDKEKISEVIAMCYDWEYPLV